MRFYTTRKRRDENRTTAYRRCSKAVSPYTVKRVRTKLLKRSGGRRAKSLRRRKLVDRKCVGGSPLEAAAPFTIQVTGLKGQTTILRDCASSDTIEDIVRKIPKSTITTTLGDVGIDKAIHLQILELKPSVQGAGFTVTVIDGGGQGTSIKGCDPSTTIQEIKKQYESQTGVSQSVQGLWTATSEVELADGSTLANAGITDAKGAELFMIVDDKLPQNCTDRELAEYLYSHPQLDKLDLTNNNMIMFELDSFGRYNPYRNLKSLVLRSCIKVTDNSLVTVVAKFPNLERIDLTDTRVTFDGMADISINCKHLKDLNLSRTHVTDRDLPAVIVPYLSKLTRFDLSHCNNVGNEGANAIAQYCTGLEVINLGFTKVTTEGANIIATRCEHLKELGLTGLTGESDGLTATTKSVIEDELNQQAKQAHGAWPVWRLFTDFGIPEDDAKIYAGEKTRKDLEVPDNRKQILGRISISADVHKTLVENLFKSI